MLIGLLYLSKCYYRPQRSCGQGNIFAPVCHSVHGGGVVSQKALRQTPPAADTPPEKTHPPGADTPSDQTPPDQTHPPPKQTPAYGLRAAGTHPTGMHSCLNYPIGQLA